MSTVYAVDSVQVMMPEGDMVLIRKGQPWSADDRVVRFKPELFTTEADAPPATSIGPDGSPVEQATAAPGEKRNARR